MDIYAPTYGYPVRTWNLARAAGHDPALSLLLPVSVTRSIMSEFEDGEEEVLSLSITICESANLAFLLTRRSPWKRSYK